MTVADKRMTFETLVEEHHALVFHVARGILRESTLAENVTQDVFLKVLQKPELFRRAGNRRAYVVRMAVNRAHDVQRSDTRRKIREEETCVGRPVLDPVEAAERSELRSFVAQLPEEQRLVVDLHYFRGLPQEEVAESLGIPRGTVSSRISAAISKLRAVMAGAACAVLLAKLDSALMACGAEEVVPPGLHARLLKMTRSGITDGTTSGGGPQSRAGRTSGAAIALATLTLFLIGIAARLWVLQAGEQPAESVTTAAAGARRRAAAVVPVKAPASNPSVSLPPEPAASGAAAPAATPSGFLVRKESGLALREGYIPGWEDDRFTPDTPESAEFGFLDGAPLESVAALADLPVSGSEDFSPFMDGRAGAESAPCAWVKLCAMDPNAPGSAGTVEYCEILTQRWLEAFRDLWRAARDLNKGWSLPPGSSRHAAVLAGTRAFDEAWHACQKARAGESSEDWRIQAEQDLVRGQFELLQSAGMAGLLPDVCSEYNVNRLLRESSSPEDWNARLLACLGEEALRRQVVQYKLVPMKHGAWMPAFENLCEVSVALQWSPARFTEIRDDQVAIFEKLSLAATAPDLEIPFDELGVCVSILPESERAALALEGGARVTNVVPAGRADRAGIRLGDILWRIRDTVVFSPFDRLGWTATFVAGEDIQGTREFCRVSVLERCSAYGGESPVRLIRNGEIVEVILGK